MKYRGLLFLVFLFTLVPFFGRAQNMLDLEILVSGDEKGFLKDKEWGSSFKTAKDIEAYLEGELQTLRSMDYLSASVDSLIKIDTLEYAAQIYLGPQFAIGQIETTEIDTTFEIAETPKSFGDLQNFQEQILSHYEEEGFPFIQLNLEDIEIVEDQINGRIKINKGRQIYIDTIELHGEVKLRSQYLNKYLDLNKGDVFKREDIFKVNEDLEELAFLSLEKPTEISFLGNEATLHVYSKKRNSSRFDFIFGVIPSDNIEGQDLFVSLDITAEMLNKLGYGEYLFFEFERLRPEQQRLLIKANYPYLLDLPIAIDGKFNIFRNSLDYLNLDSEVGIRYLLNNRDYLAVLWNFSSSRIIEFDTTAVQQLSTLPEDLDIIQNGAGIEVQISRLDYRFNPRKGISLNARILGGAKQIVENFSLIGIENENVNFQELYNELDLESYRLEWMSDFDLFIPLAQRATINIGLKAGLKYSGNGLYRNEVFQIGGYKTLRGFDEASIFTSMYIIPGIEYRLILSKNSFFSLPFVDFAWIKDFNNPDVINFGYGIGAGLSFETSVGMFNFSIASGKLGEDIPLDFGKPKAHFGFISIF